MRICRRCGAPVQSVDPPIMMHRVRDWDGIHMRAVRRFDRGAVLLDKDLWAVSLTYLCTRTTPIDGHPRECGYLPKDDTEAIGDE